MPSSALVLACCASTVAACCIAASTADPTFSMSERRAATCSNNEVHPMRVHEFGVRAVSRGSHTSANVGARSTVGAGVTHLLFQRCNTQP